MIDFRARRGGRDAGGARAVLAWTEPARSQLGIEVALPERNGAQRAREALAAGASIEDIYRDAVAETRRTYAGAERGRRALPRTGSGGRVTPLRL